MFAVSEYIINSNLADAFKKTYLGNITFRWLKIEWTITIMKILMTKTAV